MAAAAQCAAPTPKRYQRRRPERTLWYRIVQTRVETWLDLASGEDGEAPPAHADPTFCRYLECGILAHSFARAYCDECQHDFLIAYSCKGRGVCPSCNTRRMAETAAHLVDHVTATSGPEMGAGGAQTAALLPSAREAKSMTVVLRLADAHHRSLAASHWHGADRHPRILSGR